MKLIIGMLSLSGLVACAHWSEPAPLAAGKKNHSQPIYNFETVTLPKSREVSSEKKNKNTKGEEKFVAIFKCDDNAKCKPSEENKKLVPYNLFANQLKENAKRKGVVNVVKRQQQALTQSLERLKKDQVRLSSENSYYKHQIEFYKRGSLKPVIDNYKRAHRYSQSEIKVFNARIEKFEKDIEYLRNVKGIRLSMDLGTEKLMELVESGQLKFGEEDKDYVVWDFLQQVAYDLAKK